MRRLHRIYAALPACALVLLASCDREDTQTPDPEQQTQARPADPEARPDDPIPDEPAEDEPDLVLTRLCTFNAEDLRYDDIMAALRDADNEPANRARHAARLVAAIDPDILLVNELEYDHISAKPLSGDAFAQLVRTQRAALGMDDRSYQVFQAPSNTGVHSAHDLDRDGQIQIEPGSHQYAADSLGYGQFPGQYAMALFVAEPLTIDRDNARTFRTLLWKDMPGALLPPGDGERVPEDEPWYTPAMLEVLPLSSKSHWDVPVRTEQDQTLHILASHPTPPVFDGEEDRNGRRNHDEIRFWSEYLSGAEWITGDEGNQATAADQPVVVIGDLNADPEAGDSRANPVGNWILEHPLLNGYFVPESTITLQSRGRRLPPEATAEFGLRVDYIVPSKGLLVVRGGVVRGEADLPFQTGLSDQARNSISYTVSDHFPVWIDIRLPQDDQ